MTRRDMTHVVKGCSVCERVLAAHRFCPSQKSVDKLESKCRTCRAWLGKSKPTMAQIKAYEGAISALIVRSIDGLYAYEADEELEELELIAKHRGEFEQRVAVLFSHNKLLKDNWKLPVWVHATSLPEEE